MLFVYLFMCLLTYLLDCFIVTAYHLSVRDFSTCFVAGSVKRMIAIFLFKFLLVVDGEIQKVYFGAFQAGLTALRKRIEMNKKW